MKYKIFPVEKPEINQLIWYLGPTSKEILGYYLGGSSFAEADGTKRGYYAKYWRDADSIDHTLTSWNPEPKIIIKRKYNKKH